MPRSIKFIISLSLPFVAGFIGSLATTPAIPTWYASLTKPAFNPPNYLFAPVWTLLYLLMGLACYRIWSLSTRAFGFEHQSRQRRALILFFLHLVLNAAWSLAFFGLKSPLLGLLIIIALFIWIAILIRRFYRLDMLAAYLLVPYLLWVAFAATLNFAIWYLN